MRPGVCWRSARRSNVHVRRHPLCAGARCRNQVHGRGCVIATQGPARLAALAREIQRHRRCTAAQRPRIGEQVVYGHAVAVRRNASITSGGGAMTRAVCGLALARHLPGTTGHRNRSKEEVFPAACLDGSRLRSRWRSARHVRPPFSVWSPHPRRRLAPLRLRPAAHRMGDPSSASRSAAEARTDLRMSV